MTTEEFIDKLSQRAYFMRIQQPSWRRGQCLFNALHDLDAELADMIRGGPSDCFYRDDKIPRFWLELFGDMS